MYTYEFSGHHTWYIEGAGEIIGMDWNTLKVKYKCIPMNSRDIPPGTFKAPGSIIEINENTLKAKYKCIPMNSWDLSTWII